VHVLHNAVDTVRFDPDAVRPHREAVRRLWGVGALDVVFLFVAHNLRLKNLALLQSVFGRLYRELPEVRLVVVGKRAPGFCAPYLIYAGTTETMESFYAAADALLHPSFYDSFANVVLEAMSCALPVAVSDCSGASELIRNGENGFVLPVTGPGRGGVEAWTGVVRQLAASVEQRLALGATARDTAAAHAFPRYVTEFEAWLERVPKR
jgi:UDP-glucose:(heptosyl)LPS alpha-1,3-glucosyltransferase